jgi:hypothetical protein
VHVHYNNNSKHNDKCFVNCPEVDEEELIADFLDMYDMEDMTMMTVRRTLMMMRMRVRMIPRTITTLTTNGLFLESGGIGDRIPVNVICSYSCAARGEP